MKIDNHPVLPDREPDPDEAEFSTKLSATLVKALDMEELPEIVRVFRQLEAESVLRAGDDAVKTLEVKRHIAYTILMAGHGHEQSFEVFRDTWNVLVELGFSNIHMLCSTAWYYADSCMFNAQYDIGLDVIDQVTTEIHRRLEEPGLTKQARYYYNWELTPLGKLREGLVAFQTSEAEGRAWVERRDAEIEAQQPSPEEERKSELGFEMTKAMKPIWETSSERNFADVARDYRQLEADFLARLQGPDECFVPHAKRRITITLLGQARNHYQPFDVCRDLWNELLRWDFRNFEDKYEMTRVYADCCLFNKQPDAGLAVVEPVIAELQKHLDDNTDAEMPLPPYPKDLARLEKLRDALKALQK